MSTFKLEMVSLEIETEGYGAYDITDKVQDEVLKHRLVNGLVTVYSPEEHVSIVLIEYEPNLLADLEKLMKELGGAAEALLGKTVSVPVVDMFLDTGRFKRVVLVDISNRGGAKKVYVAMEGIFE